MEEELSLKTIKPHSLSMKHTSHPLRLKLTIVL